MPAAAPRYPTVTPAMLLWMTPLTDTLPPCVRVFPRLMGDPVRPLAAGTYDDLLVGRADPIVVAYLIRGLLSNL